jgi:protein TonB
MNRYLSSFAITIIIYASILFSAIVFIQNSDSFSDKKVTKPNTLSISMLAQPKQKPPKKVKKKIKKPVKKKKPIKEKVPLKEEIIKEEPEPVEEEIVKEEPKPVKQEIVKEQTPVKNKQQTIVKKQSKINHDEIEAKKNIFFTKLRNKIEQNKSYPKRARRRGIEGSVEVRFYLQSDGSVKKVEFLSGKNIFKKSIIKAIKNSFPVEVDKSLFDFPMEFKISVDYVLR